MRFRRLKKKIVLLVLFMVFGVSSLAFAGIPENDTTLLGYCQRIVKGLNLQASGTLDYYSQYVWRGFTLDTDPVVQPSFSISGKGLTFTFWSSADVDNNDSLNSNEVDLVVDYTKTFETEAVGPLSLSVGHTYYDFPGTNGYSKEFYVGAGLCKIPALNWPITSKLTFYRDYGDQNHGGGLGSYLSLALGYSHELLKDPKVSLDLGTVFGYNHHLFMRGDGQQVTLTTGLTIPLTSNLTFKPNVNYAIPLGNLADTEDGNQKNRFFGGFSMAYTF